MKAEKSSLSRRSVRLAALLAIVVVSDGTATASAVREAGEARLRPIAGTRFEFEGHVGGRIQANLEQWLLTAPDANPGLTGMLRVRDREPAPDLVPWAGEFVGKYLLSAIPMCRMVRSDQLEQTLRRVVDEVMAAQDDGYIGPFRKAERLLGHWDLWGHYHLMLALLLYSDETGYHPAFDAACRAADLMSRTYLDGDRRVFDAGSHEMNMAVIHALTRLYARTGKDDYRRMVKHIEEDWKRAGDYLRTGIEGTEFYQTPRPRWESLHDLQGLAELYRVTGEGAYRTAFLNHWDSIRCFDRHNTGAFSTGEGAVGSPYRAGAIETCCTVAWMAMTVDALALTGDSKAADELEWSLLNAMLGAQHPSGRWWTYDTPMNGVRPASAHSIVFQARAGTPELNCCSVNGPRSLAMLTDWAVMADDDGLVINYYGPMRVTAPDGSWAMAQATRYPADGHVQLTLNQKSPKPMTVKLRVPAWSRLTTVRVNDEQPERAEPGRYFALTRRWSEGDRITIALDMTPRYWPGEAEAAGSASIFRGPLLLACDQHYNTFDMPAAPMIDLQALRLQDVSLSDRFPPMVICDLATPQNDMIRLCDFATAGAHGTQYRTWLPARGGRPADFALRSPRPDEAIAPGLAVFRWVSHSSGEPHAGTFDFCVAEDALCERPILTRAGLRTARCVLRDGFAPGKRYYWKVVAHNAAGSSGNVDGPRSFTVDPNKPNTLKEDCVLLTKGPDALVIAASLDGTAEPQRGCLQEAVNVVPAPDRLGGPEGALGFNGRDSRVRYAIPEEFPQDAYTVSAWVYVEAFSDKQYQQVFSAWAAGGDDPLRISVMGTGLCARIEEAGGTHTTELLTLERGRWMHVAAVKDGQALRQYIDGECRGATAVEARIRSSCRSVALGGNPLYAGDEYFNGRIDDFALRARAMSAEEIRRLAAMSPLR